MSHAASRWLSKCKANWLKRNTVCPEQAVGGSEVGVVTGNVGDFYPNNLKSNGLGRTPYQQTGLDGQIAK